VNRADNAEFFPDDDEEEAEDEAPAVDASGQYAFQADGESMSFGSACGELTNQLPLPRVVSTSVDSNRLSITCL
jgi:hypothetical protein